jgi:small subunit ribosomal protein S6
VAAALSGGTTRLGHPPAALTVAIARLGFGRIASLGRWRQRDRPCRRNSGAMRSQARPSGDDRDQRQPGRQPGDVAPTNAPHHVAAHDVCRRKPRLARPPARRTAGDRAAATMRRRMATKPPVYDLTLLLDPSIEDQRRDTILANVEEAIDRDGEIVSRHDWGVRNTAYEIRKHADADYHLLQFHGTPALLEQLDHNLKITDGVLRFRLIKLRPGTPTPPDLRPTAAAAALEPELIER